MTRIKKPLYMLHYSALCYKVSEVLPLTITYRNFTALVNNLSLTVSLNKIFPQNNMLLDAFNIIRMNFQKLIRLVSKLKSFLFYLRCFLTPSTNIYTL